MGNESRIIEVRSDLVPLVALIARVRRAMPRNADLMKLCEELEHRLLDWRSNALSNNFNTVIEPFEGDGYAFLATVYKNKALPLAWANRCGKSRPVDSTAAGRGANHDAHRCRGYAAIAAPILTAAVPSK
jgi:hypothetical protein